MLTFCMSGLRIFCDCLGPQLFVDRGHTLSVSMQAVEHNSRTALLGNGQASCDQALWRHGSTDVGVCAAAK